MFHLSAFKLPLGTLAFRVSLPDFEPRVALANHVDSPSSTNDLAIRVTILERPNRRYALHFLNPTYLLFAGLMS